MADETIKKMIEQHFKSAAQDGLLSAIAAKIGLQKHAEKNSFVPISMNLVVPAEMEEFDRLMSKLHNQLYIMKEEGGETRLVECPATDDASTLDKCAGKLCDSLRFTPKDPAKKDEYKTELNEAARGLAAMVKENPMHECIAELNSRVGGLLQGYQSSSSSVRMQLQRQIDLQRGTLKQMMKVSEELSLLDRGNMSKLNELRKEALHEEEIDLIQLFVERPHRTRVPSLPTDAVGVNYSFETWEVEASPLSAFKDSTADRKAVETFANDTTYEGYEKMIKELREQASNIGQSTEQSKEAASGTDQQKTSVGEMLAGAVKQELQAVLNPAETARKNALMNKAQFLEEELRQIRKDDLQRLRAARQLDAAMKAAKADAKKKANQLIDSLNTLKPVFSKGSKKSGDGAFTAYHSFKANVKSEEKTEVDQTNDAVHGALKASYAFLAQGSGSYKQESGAKKDEAKIEMDQTQWCLAFETLESSLESDMVVEMQKLFPYVDASESKDEKGKATISEDKKKKLDKGVTPPKLCLNELWVAKRAIFVQKLAFYNSSAEVSQQVKSYAATKKSSMNGEFGGRYALFSASGEAGKSSSQDTGDSNSEGNGDVNKNTICQGNLTLAFLLLGKLNPPPPKAT